MQTDALMQAIFLLVKSCGSENRDFPSFQNNTSVKITCLSMLSFFDISLLRESKPQKTLKKKSTDFKYFDIGSFLCRGKFLTNQTSTY